MTGMLQTMVRVVPMSGGNGGNVFLQLLFDEVGDFNRFGICCLGGKWRQYDDISYFINNIRFQFNFWIVIPTTLSLNFTFRNNLLICESVGSEIELI